MHCDKQVGEKISKVADEEREMLIVSVLIILFKSIDKNKS